MKKILFLLFFVTIIFIKAQVFPCSGIFGADGDKVFAGNNEDYIDPETKIWVKPAEGIYKYGVLFFGFGNMFPQGGVNDQGLFFDGFAMNKLEVKTSPDKPNMDYFLTEKCMRTCATVEEVIKIVEKHNRIIMDRFQLFFCDKTGDSVIIEGDAIVRKKGKFQIVTNFRQSLTPPDKVHFR